MLDQSSSFLVLITSMTRSSEAVFSPEVNACLRIVSTFAVIFLDLCLAGMLAASTVSESDRYDKKSDFSAQTNSQFINCVFQRP